MTQNKYLEKIAASDEKSKRSDGTAKRIGKAFASLTAAGVIAKAPVALASNHLGKKMLHEAHEGKGVADLGTIKKFLRDNNLHKNVTFNTRNHMLRKEKLDPKLHGSLSHANVHGSPGYLHNSKGGRGFIAGVRKMRGGAINNDVIMHELGHAKDFQRHGAIKHVGMKIGRGAGSAMAFEAATLGALSHEKTRDYAPAIAAVPGALVLREEAAANYHGYKGIKAHKGGKAANQFLKKVVSKNMLNYGLAAAAPVAAAYVGKKVMDKWSPRKGAK